ncbi:hypothetical protein MN032_18265 [Agromyces atrinae]|uniref:hypothetical protein n=1 Tax=Agromyces atrinae TaxID=592376 RepID=UPI001F5736F9|nr:hypothetical protein [Agromyces atrinae]MCI2959633.1 hypothetical protein [Agromyces atrinae]
MNRAVDRAPRTVLIWGIVIAVGGSLLISAAPMVVNGIMVPNTVEWHSVYLVMELVLTVARAVLPMLGVSLIAASIVMRYIDTRLAGEGIADRPRRWTFPDSRD